MNNNRFLVAGLVRNASKTIEIDIKRIQLALRNHTIIGWILIESDSDDSTIEKLEYLESQVQNFKYISLGNLSLDIPDRVSRITKCRNEYYNFIYENYNSINLDFVLIADLDNINKHLSQKSIDSCWVNEDWDVVYANQDGPYYDIFALRHPLWSPSDCWQQYKFFYKFHGAKKSLKEQVYSKQITIPKDSKWLEVDSAFGGLGIYKIDAFLSSGGYFIDSSRDFNCEWVGFNENIKKNGFKIFINPSLINAKITEHTNYHTLIGRVLFSIKSLVKEILIFLNLYSIDV